MMQYIKRLAILGSILFIIVSGIILFSMNRDKTNEHFNRNITLQDSIAAVLYSSSLPFEQNGDGTSYLILIDKDGKINVMQRGGMESNSFIFANEKLILNGKEDIFTLDLHNETTEKKMQQCRVISGYGQSSGYLKQKEMYYSLYNHKFMENEPKYISYIRWGNDESQYCKEIYEYIETTGHDGEKVYLITSDLFNQEGMSLVEIEIDGDSIQENKFKLTEQSKNDRFYFTNIITDDHRLYFIVADIFDSKVQLKLIQINKTTRTIEHESALNEYHFADGTKYFFFNRDSMFLKDDKIYYVDGFGDVYAYDLQKQDYQYLFRFQDYQRKDYLNDEQVFIHHDGIYFFRYEENKKLHVIEKYNFYGDRQSIIEINGIKDMIQQKGIYIYDFKMLSHN